ncbi:MAG: thiamine-phosphate kinase [Candidatus Latescibacterota bacterium]|nr:MAG: thiamine-phosphate kinase [Candidatus Latescibacterota bacterium]
MTRNPKFSEKELLRSFARMIRAKRTPARGVVTGVGDDTAVLRPKPNEDILVTTDILVENRHFRRRWFTGFELGWRLAAVNLSDIAAMGGRPDSGLLSLAIPPGVSGDYILAIERGVRDHLAKYGATVVGGNVSGIEDIILCDLTLVGSCPRGRAWHRKCRPGRDAILVVGRLGEARAGLDVLERGVRPSFAPALIRSFKRPQPRLDVSGRFRANRAIHGAIDISDGLSSDVINLCEKSGAGCEIDAAALPVSRPLRAYCAHYSRDPIDVVMNGGEDYALILAVDRGKADGLAKKIRSTLRVPAHVIGRFTREPGVYSLVDPHGRHHGFVQGGWDHLAGR